MAFLDVFSLWRSKYKTGFGELVKATMKLVNTNPALPNSQNLQLVNRFI